MTTIQIVDIVFAALIVVGAVANLIQICYFSNWRKSIALEASLEAFKLFLKDRRLMAGNIVLNIASFSAMFYFNLTATMVVSAIICVAMVGFCVINRSKLA